MSVKPAVSNMTIERRVAQLIRPEVRALKAYAVPDARGFVKLDAMENPYGLPPALRAQWLEALRAAPLNRYPEPSAPALKARLRAALAVPDGMELILGNGSDELIQILAMAVAAPGRVLMAPAPSFVMYEMIARYVGMSFVGVPLAQDFSLDRAAMLEAIERHRPTVLFLAYPNNPTGNLFDASTIEAIVSASDGLVVVDEAYHAFAQDSFMDRLARFDNLLVMRTLSKQGLAGLRLGVLIGRDAWLNELDKLRLPYNINVLTQISAEFALRHRDVLDEQAARLRAERARVTAALAALPKVQVWPSAANFILFRVAAPPATKVFEALKADRVLIKNLHAAGGPLENCLRVTIGTPEENDAFLAALSRALNSD